MERLGMQAGVTDPVEQTRERAEQRADEVLAYCQNIGEGDWTKSDAAAAMLADYVLQLLTILDAAVVRAQRAEEALTIFEDALKRIAWNKPTGTWQEIVKQLERWARDALDSSEQGKP